MASRRVAAVDLGAQSGRVAVGAFDGRQLGLEVVHRFANDPVWLPDGLHWNAPRILTEIVDGLALAADSDGLQGVGIDGWGCDYALLDAGNRLLGLPFHYRDPARTGSEVLAGAFTRVSEHRLYRRTGIQTMPINTAFQMVAERGGAAAAAASRFALIPDLFGMWLTGSLANEVTAASTTGLLDAHEPRWATDVIDGLGISVAPFAGGVVQPGHELGPILDGHTASGRAAGATVRTVAGHDTASAYVAATALAPDVAVLSSGTWSLLGVELSAPLLTAEAEAFNLTNERGVDGTVRLLRNVMGMWLVELCRQEWAAGGAPAPSYPELYAAAAASGEEPALFDPDHESLLHPGPVTDRILALCRASGQATGGERGWLINSILVSLACKYRLVLEQLESVTGRAIGLVQVVGGGSRNRTLCQLTADVLDREVLAGPTEATLLGNVLVQLGAIGEVGTLAEMRALAAASTRLEHFEPTESADFGEATYLRFLESTGLHSQRATALPSRAGRVL